MIGLGHKVVRNPEFEEERMFTKWHCLGQVPDRF